MTPTYFPLMGRFSVSTASLVLLYKGSPTCPVLASRVSCLLMQSTPLPCPLLPVAETVFQATIVRPEVQHILIFISIILDYTQWSLQSKDSLHRW
jgi:hypothetical protein